MGRAIAVATEAKDSMAKGRDGKKAVALTSKKKPKIENVEIANVAKEVKKVDDALVAAICDSDECEIPEEITEKDTKGKRAKVTNGKGGGRVEAPKRPKKEPSATKEKLSSDKRQLEKPSSATTAKKAKGEKAGDGKPKPVKAEVTASEKKVKREDGEGGTEVKAKAGRKKRAKIDEDEMIEVKQAPLADSGECRVQTAR